MHRFGHALRLRGNPLATLLLALGLLGLVPAAGAEDGYDLWLRYAAADAQHRSAYQTAITQVVAATDSATLQAAHTELRRGLTHLLGAAPPDAASPTADGALLLGTPRSLPLLAKLPLDLPRAGTEGYVIRSVTVDGHAAIAIAANSDVGVLYGTFHLLRLLQTGQSLARLDLASAPHLQRRVLDHWDNLDGTIERGYAGGSLWDWQKLPNVLDPRYTDYSRASASVGINGSVVNSVNASALILTPLYLRKVAALADVFRPYGIHVYLTARFSAPVEIGGLATADPLDPAVRAWWRDKVDEIYRYIPDFGGLLVKANSEGQPGPQDYHRTHADGANVLADAIAPHGGIIMWRAFVYSNEEPEDRAKQAYAEFVPLDGQFRPNVLLQVKNGPIDFQPREPFHPLFGAMPHTPLMLEVQITKEYLGFATHLAYLAPLYEETLRSDTFAKGPGSTVAKVIDGSLHGYRVTGMAGVANTGDARNWCGSQFDQANWYAFGRLAWNPDDDSRAIAQDWVRMTFSNDPAFVSPVVEMMMGSREAVVDYMTPLGLHHIMGRGHHYGPGPWVAGGPRADWTAVYYHRADEKGLGFDRTASGSNAVSQYAAPLARQFADPAKVPEQLLLWFHHVSWDAKLASGRTLWDELVLHYTRGVNTVSAMRKTWQQLGRYIDGERHAEVSAFLAIQEAEARWWRDACIAYFQSFSQRPLPAGVTAPAHALAYYESLCFPWAPGDQASAPHRCEAATPRELPTPIAFSAEQDHARLMTLLHIDRLRPGADPNDPHAANAVNYDEAHAGYSDLPDPLRSDEGHRITSAGQWWKVRRPQLVEMFDRELYGRTPAQLPGVDWHVLAITHDTVGGIAVVTKQLLGRVDNSDDPLISVDIQLSVTTPEHAPARVPVMMELTFSGAPRGPAASGPSWQEQVLRRGWGYALYVPTSVQADNGSGLTAGIIGLANQGRPRGAEDWGALKAWAWGASRALDYLQSDPAVDGAHVGIEGLSRYGKAALVAMAYDARFAIGFIGSSGAGGAKLLRRDFGERVENLASAAEYHWMAGNFLKYAGPLKPSDLPVDAHELIALCAPRPVFISTGAPEVEGGWVDAHGMFLATVAAGPVYRLLGKRDLGTTSYPAQDQAVINGDLAFRRHNGGHTTGPNWPSFLEFAARYFPATAIAAGALATAGTSTAANSAPTVASPLAAVAARPVASSAAIGAPPRPLLAAVFADHAVLQRDRPIPVWGWAGAGEDVTITLLREGTTVTSLHAQASTDGKWSTQLAALAAGGPYGLRVTSAHESRQIADVLVGDVWLCSGQSNMVLEVKRTLNSREEIALAANDRIRMLTVPLRASASPLVTPQTPLEWQVSSPQTTPEFSAACYYFARELQKRVPVAMGLINSSWGGSNIQTWMDEPALRTVGGYGPALDVLKLYAADPASAQPRWGAIYENWWREKSGDRVGVEPWRADHYDSAAWRTAPAGLGYWELWGVPELAAFDGIVWYRTTVKLDAKQAAQSATLGIGMVDEIDETWVNGHPIGNTSGPDVPRRYALSAGALHAGENVIVVAALDTYGYGGMWGPAENRALRFADGSSVALSGPWHYRITPSSYSPYPRAPWDVVGGLTMIGNAMIEPLVPYGFKGVVWYQGESNTSEPDRYQKLLEGLMSEWRGKFGADLPFLIVQLADYGPPSSAPTESGWAGVREAERLAVAHDAHAGLAVAIDIGDHYDIHPANKQELGRRLARAARHVVYGEAIAPSGPQPSSARRTGAQVLVSFADVQDHLLTYSGARPLGFELCAAAVASCQYVDATLGKDSVALAVPPALTPTRVRFCWADSPVCTLYDTSGLPAGPFELAIQ